MQEWFDAVDLNRSGTLQHQELAAAFAAAKIPATHQDVVDMIQLMDLNQVGVWAQQPECLGLGPRGSGGGQGVGVMGCGTAWGRTGCVFVCGLFKQCKQCDLMGANVCG